MGLPNLRAMEEAAEKERGWRGSAEVWLAGAKEMLAEGGVEAVKIGPLAARLGMSRTSFYWHFADREALLAALVESWRQKNSAAIEARLAEPAETVTAAMLNLVDAWLDPDLFDSRADFAIRTWALTDPAVAQSLAAEDARRIEALTRTFLRFGYAPVEADTRARATYLTQVGYITLRAAEDVGTRMKRIPFYVLTFTGKAPTAAEVAAFHARHTAA